MKRRERIKLMFAFFILLLVTAMLGACGSSNKEAPSSVTGAGVATIGFEQCFNCHADAKNPATLKMPFGDSAAGSSSPLASGIDGNTASAGPDWRLIYFGWLNGPHGNYESWNGTTFQKFDNAPANTGFPYYGYEGLGTDANCTTVCHDPMGEGKTINDFYLETGIDKLGTVNRPVIGCESCHGGGGNHWGMGPLPFAKPGPDQCGQCHNKTFGSTPATASHITFHPEGGSIVEDYKASKHANSIESHNLVPGSTTDVQALCSRCHTDEGAKRYVFISNGTMTHDQLTSALDGQSNIANATPVQCRTCHDSHNQLYILGQKVLDKSLVPSQWSDEFATCTSCHQLLANTATTAAGPMLDNGYHAPKDKNGNVVNPYSKNWFAYLPSTHFDDPATAETIEGYIIDPTASHDPSPGNNNSGTCRDCHNPHNADITINKQWARSAHAGNILTVKEAAAAASVNLYTVGVTTIDEPQWTDNFETQTGGCQRCHTSTGFKYVANNQAQYSTLNSASSIPPTAFVGKGGQQELLYCWACHTSNTGNLRNPGPINSFYPMTGSTSTFTFPDASGSNVCITCHMGRSGGANIANGIDNGGAVINFANKSLRTPHHAVSAGVLYKTIGYEFSGATGTYANAPYFEHDQIGTAAVANTGTNGPCVGCHMKTPESHLYLPTSREEGTETLLAITSTVCVNCHSGQYALTVAKLNEEQAGFVAALHALDEQLQARSYFFNWANPNFYTTSAYTTQVTNWINGIDATGKNNMGSAFNLYMLVNEAGAYVHNRIYTKRLVYDSIDFLDNGVMDASTFATLNSKCISATPPTWCTAAMGWLFSTPTGSARP